MTRTDIKNGKDETLCTVTDEAKKRMFIQATSREGGGTMAGTTVTVNKRQGQKLVRNLVDFFGLEKESGESD